MTKPWRPLELEEVKKLAGNLGVYQLANEAGEVVYIGAATGQSIYGLRGELIGQLNAPPKGATQPTGWCCATACPRWRAATSARLAAPWRN